MIKRLLLFPITLISLLVMAVGALCLGYSFVAVVINSNYVEYSADVVNRVNNDEEKAILEYNVDGQTYQSSFPFVDRLVGREMVIGYNPEDPAKFHLGDQRSHFAMFIWGTFFLVLGSFITYILRKFRSV